MNRLRGSSAFLCARRTGPALALGVLAVSAALAAPPAPGERDTPRDEPRPTQHLDRSPPPAVPAATPTDPGAPLPALPRIAETRLWLLREARTSDQPPMQFNPDPGANQSATSAPPGPFFKSNEISFPHYEQQPVPADRALPRGPLEQPNVVTQIVALPDPRYGLDPLPPEQALPRADVRETRYVHPHWEAPEKYPLAESGQGFPAHTAPVPDRWRTTGFVPWRRYTAGDTNESPYFYPAPDRWHYYRQSLLKGDLPFRGPDLFLSLTAESETLYEDRQLPVPSGVSASRPGSFDFFGESRSQVFVSNLALKAVLFRGETVFKPVEWLVLVRPVLNYNRVGFREALVSPDPRGSLTSGVGSQPNNSFVTNPSDIDRLLAGNSGFATAPGDYSVSRHTTRTKNYISLQEAFFEKHLRDLSANYDFCAIKVGNQTFNSDFRGFIFNDTNLGARFFGNYDNNRWQYNAALFDLREKDTNSELNTFDRRGQVVFIANVYRQDFLTPGYTAELNFHASFDQSSLHYDTNGGIVRPAPLGGPISPHRVNSYYFGWTGDGHVGRWNISHAAYAVVGRDELNGLAGRPVDIFAQMAAVELSYDRDWIRYKASAFWASGDNNATDRRGAGFDSILDNTNFTGGPFSYYVRQGFNLAGTAVGVKQRFSLLPDLRTSKAEGQQNFVNPGLFLLGLGSDLDVTPRLRAFLNANVIRFDTTETLKAALLTNQVARAFGTDLSVGVQWRPLLKDNVIVSSGCGVLLPARGFRDIYRTTQPAVPGFTAPGRSAAVDHQLYSATLAVTLTY